MVTIRNDLVHGHLYWPEGGDLQITGIGTPPIYNDLKFKAPPPNTIRGLELYERSLWLKAFSLEVNNAFTAIPTPITPEGTLGKAPYQSAMPKGWTSGNQKKDRATSMISALKGAAKSSN